MQKTKEEIILISRAVEEAAESNARLQEQKNELEVKQEEAIIKLKTIEQVLIKSEASYLEAKDAELKLIEIESELEKEKICREELENFTDTLKVKIEVIV